MITKDDAPEYPDRVIDQMVGAEVPRMTSAGPVVVLEIERECREWVPLKKLNKRDLPRTGSGGSRSGGDRWERRR